MRNISKKKLNFKIDDEVTSAINKNAELIKNVSVERINKMYEEVINKKAENYINEKHLQNL